MNTTNTNTKTKQMLYTASNPITGNLGTHTFSQEEADSALAVMDANGNKDCTDCIDCIDCINCNYCINCHYCNSCTSCTDCNSCTNCTNCTNCIDCINCTSCDSCSNCNSCNRCTDCTSCTNCNYCINCHYCTYCNHCTDCNSCTDCTDCTDCIYCTYIARWTISTRTKTVRLRVFTGLKYPIAWSDTHLQIGCHNFSIEDWKAMDDVDLFNLDGEAAIQFNTKYRNLILQLIAA